MGKLSNLEISESNTTMMMSSSRKTWKTERVVRRVTDEPHCAQREETESTKKIPKMCLH